MRLFPDGNMGVGHVRYGTTGSNDRSNSQPLGVNWSCRAQFSTRPVTRKLSHI
jgi:glutamine phosphoribosylpyrophosphate amidotransferase